MPLITISGYPCSHKTNRAEQLKKYFEGKGKTVHLLSEYDEIVNAGFDKNSVFASSLREKQIRNALKSKVASLISPNDVIICDGLNYIKGYRYELYCLTKASYSTHCTVYTIINRDTAWTINESKPEAEQYSKDVFEALLLRYEEPDGQNRWDMPLFTTADSAELDCDGIYNALCLKEASAPNQSTSDIALSSSTYLSELNKIITDITNTLIKHVNSNKDEVCVLTKYNDAEVDVDKITGPKILGVSRQFIKYCKTNPPTIGNAGGLYIKFIQQYFSSDPL